MDQREGESGWGFNSSEDAGHCFVLYNCKYTLWERGKSLESRVEHTNMTDSIY
jgi:hypothetical protein